MFGSAVPDLDVANVVFGSLSARVWKSLDYL